VSRLNSRDSCATADAPLVHLPGLQLGDVDCYPVIDVTIDGADE
jgi:ribose 5-phosphate isomerase